MKRFLIIAVLFIPFFVSCDKEDESSEEIPAWLQKEIDEVVMVSSMNICEVCTVTISEYKGVKYYDFYCGHWSCRYCYFFDQNGDRPVWETEDWDAYEAGKKQLAVVPACRE